MNQSLSSNLKTQFVTDSKGKKVAVILPMKNYQKMLEELDELQDVRLYDKAKKEDDGKRISLTAYLKKRNGQNG